MDVSSLLTLPKHFCLSISHNEHKGYHYLLREYLELNGMDRLKDMVAEDIKECLDKDELWEIQLYPKTPISFYWVGAATLERCIELMNEIEELKD